MANQASATYAGRSIITSRLKGGGSEPKNIGWGTGSQTASTNSDVNLFAPATESRVAGSSTQVLTAFLADTYQVTGSITCIGSGKTITEAGLFDSVTNPSNTTPVLATSLVASIAAGTATLTLAVALNISSNYYAQVGNEVVLVTSGQNTTLVGVARAQLGSVAGGYNSLTPFTPGGDGGANAAGLGSATTTWTAALGGSMFAHADFAGIAVSVNDSINFTFKDQFN